MDPTFKQGDRLLLNRLSIHLKHDLQRGDVIRLNRKVDDELDVYVGDICKFTALPGSIDKKYAVRVTTVIREEDI